MLTKTVTATIPNAYNIKMTSIECSCGKAYPFTSLHQELTCSNCGRLVKMSDAMKMFMIKEGSAKPVN